MNKIITGISVALIVVCLMLAWRLKVVTEDLAVAEISLKEKENTIREQADEIRITNDTITSLQHEKEALVQERLAANAKINEMLNRGENCSWGKERLPDDVCSFLNNIKNDGKDKPKEK